MTLAPFKIAVVGCGGMSEAWIRYAEERRKTLGDVEIVALVDLRKESAEAKARAFELKAPCFTSLDEALRSTGANLVFDISIPESHKTVALTAFSHGCSVFGEKPMASSLADAREMVAAAKKAGVRYSVMQNRRYLPGIRAYRQLVAEHLGQVGLVNADFYLGPHFGGFRDSMDSPLVLDMAIHTFDMARLIAGADPVSVYCKESNPSWSWYKGASSATCVFELENGAVFTYRGSWAAEGAPTTWEGDWRVVGAQGTALWNGADEPWAEVVSPLPAGETMPFQRSVERRTPGGGWLGRSGHDGCLDEMFAALKEGRPAETDCADNVKSVQMVFGALESSRTGKIVSL